VIAALDRVQLRINPGAPRPVDIAAGFLQVGVPGGGTVHGGRYLGHANTQDFSAGAGSARPYPDENTGDARPHELQARFASSTLAGHDELRSGAFEFVFKSGWIRLRSSSFC